MFVTDHYVCDRSLTPSRFFPRIDRTFIVLNAVASKAIVHTAHIIAFASKMRFYINTSYIIRFSNGRTHTDIRRCGHV